MLGGLRENSTDDDTQLGRDLEPLAWMDCRLGAIGAPFGAISWPMGSLS
jgi:hypothetical protein